MMIPSKNGVLISKNLKLAGREINHNREAARP